ncbi:MAG: glycoside-pentoside-hexuronide (GPH):cation symporter [Bifidobacteriaceae bacterium]|jgi:lactose/raffinose/galactose permease|nr:glycoside-pentoside-hexuronide (GPH):cation symporter [Bifidobacteriaceae bacterium]
MNTTNSNKKLILEPSNSLKVLISYGIGGFGNDVFYAIMSTYFTMFITSQLFGPENAHWVVVLTSFMMILRILEIFIDPMFGGIIDNTRTRIGKFKPWILIGGGICSLMLAILFSDFFGLPTSNPMFYVVLFAITYLVMDVFYSMKDTSYWGMLSAIAIDSRQRNKIGTAARFGSVAAQALTMILAVPLIKFFSSTNSTQISSEAIGDKTGWFFFGLIGTLVAFLTCIIVAVGTKEGQSKVRKSEKMSVGQVFKTIASNDQLMWIAIAYVLFCIGQVTTNQLLVYFFTYIVGDASLYSVCGIINLISGFVAVALFPILAKTLGRKSLFLLCLIAMIASYFFFLITESSPVLAYIGCIFFMFPYPILFLCVMMTITDTVEYGQWKNGKRAEATTLVIRPMCDKFGGAVSNGIAGLTAIFCGMNQGSTANTVAANSQNLINFKILMIVIPLICLVVSGLIYWKKVKIDEKMHAKIIKELEARAN